MLKQIQVPLYPPEQSNWYGDIKKHWCSVVFIVEFEKIPHLFLVFHCWIWGLVSIHQRSKYRLVKITKPARTGTNYVVLTKQVRVQHEKKPVSNFKSMQIFLSTKFIKIFIP